MAETETVEMWWCDKQSVRKVRVVSSRIQGRWHICSEWLSDVGIWNPFPGHVAHTTAWIEGIKLFRDEVSALCQVKHAATRRMCADQQIIDRVDERMKEIKSLEVPR